MSRVLNNYSQLADTYQQTLVKPDKKFSILPTVLTLAGNLSGKIVVDLGCGSGFFTNEFAQNGAKKVIGVDNSSEQIRLAKKNAATNTKYILGDIFEDRLPAADSILAPYVVNYATDTQQLTRLFKNIHAALKPEGTLITVVDMPEGKDLKKFGAIKTLLGKKRNGTKIEIQLFNDMRLICKLHAVYFTKTTLKNTLKSVGFTRVTWHTPIISNEGVQKFGSTFWDGYVHSPELGYITAVKLR